MTTPSIEPLDPADLPAVQALLLACGLPAEDARVAPGAAQFVCREDGAIVGTVGVDVSGGLALLRSLAVAPAARGRGLGLALTQAAEAHAVAAGARTLLLLTTTADALAQGRGFTAVSRCSLGDGVLAFRQFAASCCAEARCYVKNIEGGKP